MEYKYVLTDNIMEFRGYVLRQIKCLRDINTFKGLVKAGTLGGWIEHEGNLKHDGNCWVFPDSYAMGNSCVSDNAVIADNAFICDSVFVCDNAFLSGESNLSNVIIKDNAVVAGKHIMRDASIGGRVFVGGECVIISSKIYDYVQILAKGATINHAIICDEARILDSCYIGMVSEKSDDVVHISGNAKITDKATIERGCTISDYAWVGSNSLVKAGSVIDGHARVICYSSSSTIDGAHITDCAVINPSGVSHISGEITGRAIIVNGDIDSDVSIGDNVIIDCEEIKGSTKVSGRSLILKYTSINGDRLLRDKDTYALEIGNSDSDNDGVVIAHLVNINGSGRIDGTSDMDTVDINCDVIITDNAMLCGKLDIWDQNTVIIDGDSFIHTDDSELSRNRSVYHLNDGSYGSQSSNLQDDLIDDSKNRLMDEYNMLSELNYQSMKQSGFLAVPRSVEKRTITSKPLNTSELDSILKDMDELLNCEEDVDTESDVVDTKEPEEKDVNKEKSSFFS